MDQELNGDFPWSGSQDERFTLALILDVAEVLTRHGYPPPTGTTLVELANGLHHALHWRYGYRPTGF